MAYGYTFFGNKLLQADRLARFLASVTPSDFHLVLADANGFFAVVQVADTSLVAAVDRIRSIPLFYAHTNGDIYVSDDAYWVAEQIGEDQYDKLSAAEFLLTGYVTGANTLHSKVRQLQAGELLHAKSTPSGIEVTKIRYYQFIHGNYIQNREQLLEEWDKVLVSAFSRLIKSVNGRPIAIPLSGGKDSRLIAIMLKRLGYENVICYSYGLPGNWNSKISEQVALKLNYRWKFIPYSHQLWHDSFHSKEYRAYVRYADGLSSVAFIQDWPAVWKMKVENMLPENSVFVPGHGGDPIEGSQIPTAFGWINQVRRKTLVNAIMTKHYNLWNLERLETQRLFKMSSEEVRVGLGRKIHSLLDGMPYSTMEEAANAFEHWTWQEREAKFIVNSVRVYEFWGYSWRLPLWDSELMHFWQRVPLYYRLQMRLRTQYIEKLQEPFGIKEASAQITYLKPLLDTLGLLELVKRFGFPEMFDEFVDRMRRKSFRRVYERHPLGWYGIISMKDFSNLYQRKPENVNSLLAIARLGIVSF